MFTIEIFLLHSMYINGYKNKMVQYFYKSFHKLVLQVTLYLIPIKQYDDFGDFT